MYISRFVSWSQETLVCAETFLQDTYHLLDNRTNQGDSTLVGRGGESQRQGPRNYRTCLAPHLVIFGPSYGHHTINVQVDNHAFKSSKIHIFELRRAFAWIWHERSLSWATTNRTYLACVLFGLGSTYSLSCQTHSPSALRPKTIQCNVLAHLK